MRAFEQVKEDKATKYEHGGESSYKIISGLLYRVYTNELGRQVKQSIVPVHLRQGVLHLAHDSIMTGHLGVRKTGDRVLANFFWPGLSGDVARYCRLCGICQRTIPKGRIPVAPLQKMPIIDVPFQRVAMDLIGPIEPVSELKNRYILTVVDFATRYP